MSEMESQLEREIDAKTSVTERVEQLLENVARMILDANGDEEMLAQLMDALNQHKAHLAEMVAGE